MVPDQLVFEICSRRFRVFRDLKELCGRLFPEDLEKWGAENLEPVDSLQSDDTEEEEEEDEEEEEEEEPEP